MNRRLLLAAWFVLTFGCKVARAADEQPTPTTTPAARPEASPVRAGKTTVTVIDENESVDDVVTRVRAARGRELEKRDQPARPGATATPAPGQNGPRPRGDGSLRAAVRDARAAGVRPGPVVRERVRERLNDRKAARPRAGQLLRRQRAR